MSHPTIGVLITSYNKEQYLNRTISSIICQTQHPDSICIIDDCSSDNSREIIEKSIPQLHNCGINVTFIKNEINLGAAESRNLGIESLLSDYIVFLDADDQYDTKYIETLHDLIAQEPFAGMICCAVKTEFMGTILPSNKLIKQFKPIKRYMEISNPLKSLAIESFFIGGGNVCFNRKLAKSEKFEVGEKNMEEWDFYYRILHHCMTDNIKVIFIPTPLYIYNNIDDESLSRKGIMSIDEISLPKIISRLNSSEERGYRNFLLSIWIYNSITRLSSTRERVKFVIKYFDYILSAKKNRYWLGAIFCIICSKETFKKFKYWRKKQWYNK